MDEQAKQQIEQTWEEVGHRARPIGNNVFVRTELLPEYVGSIYIPPSQRTNYAGLGHSVFMRALVLSAGPESKGISAGDRVAFPRLFFARWKYLDDGTLVGYIKAEHIQAEFGENLEGGVKF